MGLLRTACFYFFIGNILGTALLKSYAAENDFGWEPFSRGDWTFESRAMYGFGDNFLGGGERHDFLMANIQGGYLLTDRLVKDRFYSGYLELTGSLWGAHQVNPDDSYLVGVTPGIRYHIHTGTRLVPHISAGAGLSWTDIGEPDLSGHFQFNEFIGGGFHWFFHDHWAIDVEYQFMHISNAGIEQPNRGVNSHFVVLGLLYKF